jgi:hypothetical protein
VHRITSAVLQPFKSPESRIASANGSRSAGSWGGAR